jgi:hypothetical protein
VVGVKKMHRPVIGSLQGGANFKANLVHKMRSTRLIFLLTSFFIFCTAFAADMFDYELKPVQVLLVVAMSIITAVTCPFIKDE